MLTSPSFVVSVVFANINTLKGIGELKTLLSIIKCSFKNCFNGKGKYNSEINVQCI